LAYEERVIASLRPRLDRLVTQWSESGRPLPDPDELAATLTSAVPGAVTHSDYDRLLGPFYSSAGVMRVLAVPTKQALGDRRRRGTLLAARTSDRVWVYPAFQFDLAARQVRRDLVPLLSALKAAPRWGAALWLVTSHPELGGKSPMSSLGDGKDDLVARLAAQYAGAVSG
jgi:hypothetical protein